MKQPGTMRALVGKELRETWWIGAIAAVLLGERLLASAGLQADLSGVRATSAAQNFNSLQFDVPLAGYFGVMTSLIQFTACVCLALAARQTLGESMQRTWSGLFFRPVIRQQVLQVKFFTGFTVAVLSTGLPLLLAVVVADQLQQPRPFYMWVAKPAVITWTTSLTFYPTAFLCGMSVGRWWGSRLLPLGVSVSLVSYAWIYSQSWLVLVLVIGGIVVATMLLIRDASSKRDY